jgi:hypothetical protein
MNAGVHRVHRDFQKLLTAKDAEDAKSNRKEDLVNAD